MKRYFPYILLTIAIALPLWLPGYIMTLDLVFTPELRMPESVTHAYVWHSLLHFLNLLLPSQIIEKAILSAIPLTAAIGMHRLVVWLRQDDREGLSWYWPTYIAGIFYAVNPFTYSRLMAGQYAVLIGYALLPFFARLLLEFLDRPGRSVALKLTAISLAISIISIHTLGLLLVITFVIGIGAVWRHRHKVHQLSRYVRWGMAGLGVFVAVSSYWLIPLALGQGDTARTIQQFDRTHSDAFATVGSTVVSQLFNVLNLQGFWADGRGLYALPQDQMVAWGTVRLLLWALIVWGGITLWRHRRSMAAPLLALLCIGLVLAIGIPQAILSEIGYREPHKFAALVAFCFTIFLAYGCARLLHVLRQKSEGRYTAGACVLLLLVVLFTPTIFWGAAGQLKPRQYPAGWYRLNDRLGAQAQTHTIFLPWHQYMSFDFSGRIIANPAKNFFDAQVITSQDPELGAIKPAPTNGIQTKAQRLFGEKNVKKRDITTELAAMNVKYLILAKAHDYRQYDYLNHTSGLTVVWEDKDITLYRNTACKGESACHP